jgi:hypothetical protein
VLLADFNVCLFNPLFLIGVSLPIEKGSEIEIGLDFRLLIWDAWFLVLTDLRIFSPHTGYDESYAFSVDLDWSAVVKTMTTRTSGFS